jgi:restriction system protein
MARRKQKQIVSPQIFFGALAVLGVLWLLTKVADALSRSGSTIGFVLMMAFAVIAAVSVFRFIQRVNGRKALLRKTERMTEQQLEPFLRRRAQLVRLDPYGKPVREKWAKEIDYFITQHIQPSLTAGEQAALARSHSEVAALIAERVEAAQQAQPAFRTFSDDMTPAEFETFCAEQLRLAGWTARVTMQSRDQGVDVVAEKDGRRVVLQCKLYARPVGNKSVQEATAARAHERADFGIVVSNNRYTDAAEELARTNRVLLLHYRDLQKLDDLLRRQG